MPSPRKPRLRRRHQAPATLTRELLRSLLFGRGFFGPLPTETVRSAWDVWRDSILPPWIQRHPGTRPFGWWLCESPGERQTTEHFAGRDRAELLLHGILHTYYHPPMQESDADFLLREKLLSAEERRALDAGEVVHPLDPGTGTFAFFRGLLIGDE